MQTAVMKATLVIFALKFLLLFWVSPVAPGVVMSWAGHTNIPLDMIENSVDDMYFNCHAKMEEQVKAKVFQKEIKGPFEKVWGKARACAERQIKNGNRALTRDHRQALCVYTDKHNHFFSKFNEAVRTNRSVYHTSFAYHLMHFWLTRAVQILSSNEGCHLVYRRNNVAFTGKVDQLIRFGSFASSSKFNNQTDFGTVTCFQIETCAGAHVKKYSEFPDEEEVLIPPYEMFRIVKKDISRKILEDCETVYVLKSSGVHSNLNCVIVDKPR